MKRERRERMRTEKKCWDEHAERYDNWYGTLEGAVEHEVDLRLLTEYLPRSKAARILDAAAGTGRVSLPLARMGYSITLCDISTGMLDVARRKLSEENLLERVDVVEGDICALGFDDETFDFVICWDGMSREAAKELIRVTKKGKGQVSLFLSNRCRSVVDAFEKNPEDALRLLRAGAEGNKSIEDYPQSPMSSTVSEARAFFENEGVRVDAIHAVCGMVGFFGLSQEVLESKKWDKKDFDALAEVLLWLAKEPTTKGLSRHLAVYGTRMESEAGQSSHYPAHSWGVHRKRGLSMRMSRLVGRRIKETPKDAKSASHIFLIRGGYVRPVSAGIYSLLPTAKRIMAKIETILRDEMNRIDGQEILMPVVLPRELWEESGRYASIGQELLRFKDRNDKDMLLAMTHEEAVVQLARAEVTSYKQLPFMLYQIQTKYRDEARPRAGMIRVREFSMKDAYSFHADAECLKRYYQRAYEAYVRIFTRVGLKNVIAIQSDPGMMGGSLSHEFMAVAECGEDTFFLSPEGRYKANRDVATTALTFNREQPLPVEKVHTPGCESIEEVAAFLGVPTEYTGKAVFYSDPGGALILVVIRGDIEVNETKLKNHLQVAELDYAGEEQIRAIGCEPGYASPVNVDPDRVRIIFDPSARESSNLVVGANEPDYHFRNFNFERDLGTLAERVEVVDIATARPGDPCPITGEPLRMLRGIELGNIFQLGTKYSESMKCLYLDRNGQQCPMIMGCYGIGIGRTMAAVIEQSHDEYGPIWPIAIAPWQVHLCALNIRSPGVRETAETIYHEITDAGIEIVYDDRGEKAGSAFNDADLMGVPLRLIVSPKTVGVNQVEFKTRDGTAKEMIARENVVAFLHDRITKAQR